MKKFVVGGVVFLLLLVVGIFAFFFLVVPSKQDFPYVRTLKQQVSGLGWDVIELQPVYLFSIGLGKADRFVVAYRDDSQKVHMKTILIAGEYGGESLNGAYVRTQDAGEPTLSGNVQVRKLFHFGQQVRVVYIKEDSYFGIAESQSIDVLERSPHLAAIARLMNKKDKLLASGVEIIPLMVSEYVEK